MKPGAPEREEVLRIARRRRHIGGGFDAARSVRDLDVPDHDIGALQHRPHMIEERVGLWLVKDQIADQQNA